MRSSFLLTAAIGIVLAGTARADISVGTVAPDIEAKEWLNSEQAISLPEVLVDDPYRGFDTGLTGRTTAWAKTLEIWMEAPLFGVGFRQHESMITVE